MFTFTPLLGAQAQSRASQSLLELDGGIKILIDVGWDEGFDVEQLKGLEEHIPSLSVVLLTHPTLDHLGAYAYLCKHVPQFKSIPVYATQPVVSLGRTLLQDLYLSSQAAATVIPASSLAEATYLSNGLPAGASSILLQSPTTEEIAGYFSTINPLKYSQPTQPIASPFSPSLDGLTITAYGAGHTLGGTIWHIQHGLESIVYAVDWNQAKENTLSGAAWLASGGGGAEILEPLRRPTALICSSRGIERPHVTGGRKKRDDHLLETIDQVISSGGTVLIPSDSSARILELAYIVEQFWRRQRASNVDSYKHARVHLASRTAGSTLRFARSMVEWMDDSLVRDLEATNDAMKNQKGQDDRADQTPFDFRHVKLVERKARLERILSAGRPGVILASDTSLDWGFSMEALQRLCSKPNNLIILTEPPSSTNHSSLSTSLWDLYQSSADPKSASVQIIPTSSSMMTRQGSTVPLAPTEFPIYQQYLARLRQVQSTQATTSTSNAPDPAAGDVDNDGASSSSSSSDDDDDAQQGRALNVTATSKRRVDLSDADLGVNVLLRRKGVYDYDVRGKRGREKMFPFATRRGRGDEYGEVIRAEDYRRAEEIDGEVAGDDGIKEEKREVGEKRKWGNEGSGRKKLKTEDRDERRQGDEDSKREASESDDEDDGPEEPQITGPRKLVWNEVTLDLKLGIAHVDFSALHERRDLQMLIPLIRPQKLVITSGTEREVTSLAEDCRTLLGEEDGEGKGRIVFTPKNGESVDVSVDTNAWSVKLSRDLVRKLAWQTVKGLSVVAVTAKLALQSQQDTTTTKAEPWTDEQKRKKQKLEQQSDDTPAGDTQTGTKPLTEPVLDIPPATTGLGSSRGGAKSGLTKTGSGGAHQQQQRQQQQQQQQPIHVGDLRLADLRKLMQAGGHVAEFKGEGTLLIDGTVIVRKSAGGKVEVEGGAYMGAGRYDPTLSFLDVRKRIYEGLAVVAGG